MEANEVSLNVSRNKIDENPNATAIGTPIKRSTIIKLKSIATSITI